MTRHRNEVRIYGRGKVVHRQRFTNRRVVWVHRGGGPIEVTAIKIKIEGMAPIPVARRFLPVLLHPGDKITIPGPIFQ
jgi:hypothetical protein